MKDNVIVLKILRPLIKFASKFILRAEFNGLENIPDDGGVILAGTHTHIFDCLLLISASKRLPHFIVKKELYNKKIGAWFFGNAGTIPVDRSKKNPDAMKYAKKELNSGKVIAIFPEGTINKTEDNIMPFKYGAVKLSVDTNSPIVPFVIFGKYKFFKKSVSITFLKPLKISNDVDKYNKMLMNIINDEIVRRKNGKEEKR